MPVAAGLFMFILLPILPQVRPAAAEKREAPTILLSRPAGPERDAWLGSLIQSYIHFRLGVSPNSPLVPLDTLFSRIPDYDDFGSMLDESSYGDLVKEFGVSLVVNQNFALSQDGSEVEQLIEIVSAKDGELLHETDRAFPLDMIGPTMDSVVLWICGNASVQLPSSAKRFFLMNVVPPTPEKQQMLGRALSACWSDDPMVVGTAGETLMKMVDEDPRLLMAQFYAGKCLARAGRSDLALKPFRELLDVVPTYAGAYPPICALLREANNPGQALKYIQAANGRGIRNSELQLEKALALEALGDDAQAAEAYKSVLDSDSDNLEALLFFAQRNNREGNHAEALKFADRLLAVSKNSGRAHLEKGKAYVALGKQKEATGALEKAVEYIKESAEPFALLGDMAADAGELEKAIQHYRTVTKLAPNSLDAGLKLAMALKKSGNADEAIQILKMMEPTNRSVPQIQKELGFLYLRQGDSSNAFVHLDRYAKIEEKDGTALLRLADIYTGNKVFDQALYYYQKALELLEDKTECKMSLAHYYMARDDSKSAIKYLEEVLEESPDYPNIHLLLADAWFEMGNPPNALEQYEKHRAKIGKADKHVQRRIALLAFASGDKKRALTEYRRLVEVDGTDPKSFFRLAILSIEQKNAKEGEAYLKKALEFGKPDLGAFVAVGDAYRAIGEFASAAKYYRKAVEVDGKREDLWLRLVDSYKQTKQDSALAECYVVLFNLKGDEYKSQLAQAGHIFTEKGLEAKALTVYELFLGRKFSDPEVNVNLAKIKFRDKKYKEVIALLEGLGNSGAKDPETQRMLGIAYAELGEHKKAAGPLAIALEDGKDEPRLVALTAKVHDKAGRAEDAVKYYQLLLKTEKSDASSDIAFRIGRLYEELKQIDPAVAQYEKNAEKYPKELRNYERLVELYGKSGDKKRLQSALERAVKLPKAPKSMLKGLAQLQDGAGEKAAEQAAQTYSTYLEEAPEDGAAWLRLGTILYENNKYEQALEPLETALKLTEKPTFEHVLMLGRGYKAVGQKEKDTGKIARAAEFLEQAHKLRPKDKEILVQLTECKRRTGDTEGLIANLGRLSELDKKNLEVHSELGKLLLENEAYEEAAEVLEIVAAMKSDDKELHLDLASIYEKLGERKKRVDHLEAALKIGGDDPEIQLSLAGYYAAEGENKRAAGLFEKALSEKPKIANAYFQYGMLLGRMDKPEEALKQLKIAVKADPKNLNYALTYSKMAEKAGMRTEALEGGRGALAVAPDNGEVLGWLGSLYYKDERTDSAKVLLREAIKTDRTCGECYRILGDIYLVEGKYDQAVEAYTEAEGKVDEDLEGVLALKRGQAHLLNGDNQGASEIFELYLEGHPNDDKAVYWVVHTKVQQGDLDKAEGILREYGKAGDGKKSGWINLAGGELSEARGKIDDAFVAYSVATRVLPDVAQGYAGCGRVMLKRKNYSSAVMYFGNAMAKEPYNVEYLASMGEVYEAQGEAESAVATYSEVIKVQPRYTNAYYSLARLYSSQGKHKKALSVIEEGLKGDPNNPKLYFTLGHVFRDADKPQKAIEAYEKALDIDKKAFYDAYRQIGMIYYHKLVDNDNAMKSFKRYRRMGGEDPSVKTLMAKMDK